MGTVTDIDAARQYCETLITCKQCSHKWVARYPVATKALECPGCHNAVNEYGTAVFVARCKTCGTQFTVCPKPDKDREDEWEHCMSVECGSYDKSRDADILFDAGLVKRDDDD